MTDISHTPPTVPFGSKIEWKVIEAKDFKTLKSLEEALNDEWMIAQIQDRIYVLARVLKP